MMHILVVDDDPLQLEQLSRILQQIQYPPVEIFTADSYGSALRLFNAIVFDLVITDLRLPEGSGLDILKEVKKTNPMVPVIVMTAFSSAQEAVEILKAGADDYLIKPTKAQDIEKIVLRSYEKNMLIRESFLPPLEGKTTSPFAEGIIYKSESMAFVMQIAARCAESDATVVVSGESGTGKELVARFIHERSLRKHKPFVAVNISALPESLAESELFGHKRGAFTGADTDRMGRFELADGGTLFIDEIGDVPVHLQVKLLRVLQFGIIERVGENTPRKLDVRVIAATNKNLPQLVEQGLFRKDLFYRINVITLDLPPLRERKEDIPLLVQHFIEKFNQRNHRMVQGVSREAMEHLMRYDYPGNVRELENIIERAVVLSRGDIILERDLPPLSTRKLTPGTSLSFPLDYREVLGNFERTLIERALQETKGNKSAAARLLGISERHLRSRLERLYPKDSPLLKVTQ
ncbi:MAG: sigma-54 dependent transcriptional regulator [Treponemataceae bacterium]|nr:sigma-54 dependent transcriptional regulator [Treponemataceae bacterium]